MTCTYVEDTIGTGDPSFQKLSRLTEQRFQTKYRDFDSTTFAGSELDRTDYGFIMHHKPFSKKVKELSLHCIYAAYRSKRHYIAWLLHTRPNVIAYVNRAAQITEKQGERKHVLEINRLVRCVHRPTGRGLRQHKLGSNILVLKVFTDSSFANTPYLKSQLGYPIVIPDVSGQPQLFNFQATRIAEQLAP